MRENKLQVPVGYLYNRIPNFVDSDKAIALLAETEEFKKANHIKVQMDRVLNGVKLQAVLANKNLYLPSTSNSKALYMKVVLPADATDEQKAELVSWKYKYREEERVEIGIENKVPLDMVVLGSVVVSRDGYRIGRGNGYSDLDIGLLAQVGSLTPNTLIVTLVHDVQVVDNLPTHLFQKFDTPVDIIVTPTEVIRVGQRLPRPTGIFWELLSQRRLKIVPVLEVLKETLEKLGNVIVLKAEDTDIEQNQPQQGRNRRRFVHNRRNGGRRFGGRTLSQTNAEEQGDGTQPQIRNSSRRRRFTNRRRRPTKSEGDQSGVESKSQERRSGGDAGKQKQKFLRKPKRQRDFSVKLTNITSDVRIKDLKSELRSRQCNPLAITWKGKYGRCYLHFGHRNGQPSTEEEMNKVLQSLNDLSLTITPREDNNVVEGAANGAGDQEKPTPADTKTPTVINLKVELIKHSDKPAGKDIGSGTEGGNAAVNGSGEHTAVADHAAGGDATSGHAQPVDTTTV